MMTIAEFYATWKISKPFWFWDTLYTIVPGRHIGTDYVNGTADIPALLPGRVVKSQLSSTLGRFVIIDTGWRRGRFHTYAHLANDRLPQVGEWIEQGARVGRAALGPKTLPMRHPEFPGLGWTGQHLHHVIHDIIYGSYLTGWNDTYYSTAALVAELLAAPADGAMPIPQEDDMYSDEDRARDIATAAQAAKNAADIDWIKRRIGGSDPSPDGSLTDMGRWVKNRIGGSTKVQSVTDALRKLVSK